MPEQEDLFTDTEHRAPAFNPLSHGIYRRFVDDGGRIKDTAWRDARGTRETVGSCRNCGGNLKAGKVEDVTESRRDYRGGCVDCGREFCAPNGQTLARSGLARERPAGKRRRPENDVKTSPGQAF